MYPRTLHFKSATSPPIDILKSTDQLVGRADAVVVAVKTQRIQDSNFSETKIVP
jgi:hypothetical protein